MSQERAMLAVEAVTGKPAPGRRRAAMRAAEAARPKTADEKAGEVISFGVGVLGPLLCIPLAFLLLSAGPPGWILLGVLMYAWQD